MYHIEIIYENNTLFEINQSKESVRKKVDAWQNNQNFMFYERPLFPKRVGRFLVFTTDYEVSSMSSVKTWGTECSSEFYTEPPVWLRSTNIDDIHLTKEGLFIKGQSYDALSKVDELIQDANESIILVDGYINKDNLDLLSEKKESG